MKERRRRENYDIEITTRDCGEPREIEYANEEEWATKFPTGSLLLLRGGFLLRG